MDIMEVKNTMLENMETLLQESAKEALIRWLKEAALPALKEIADVYIEGLKKDSESETGWCKVRDGVVLPMTIQGGLWFIAEVLEKIEGATAHESA